MLNYKFFGDVNKTEWKELVKESLDIAEKKQNKQIALGIKSGLYDLDKITGGWQDSDLIIVGARPSMGKTAMMLKFAKSAALNDKSVVMFSIEMNALKLTDRIIVGMSGVNANNYRDGYLRDDEWVSINNSIDEIERLKFIIDDYAAATTSYIRKKAKILKRKNKCDMIIIDYLQLMDSDEKSENRNIEVGKISHACKKIAKEIGVPVILLAQLSRKCEERRDKRPQLSDLRDSGEIEQDADVVIFVYRDEFYGIEVNDDGENTKGLMELLIRKHRNGSTGVVKCGYNESLTDIYDLYENNENNKSRIPEF